MKARRSRNSGFTLVEILIVVIILGILAAIVIPQFSKASEDARTNSLSSQLQTIRSQIELYKVQHHDALPNLTTNWDQLTTKTDDTGATGTGDYGPYLQQVPMNPINNLTAVVGGDGTTASATDCGFIYDYNGGTGTGHIYGTTATKKDVFVENQQ